MTEKFSLLRFTIEATLLKKLSECKWWQFSKRKDIYNWHDKELLKIKP